MGSDEFKINFPKTFKTHPVVSINLEHENGGIIPPAIISDVTLHDFVVKFGAPIKDQGYHLHTTALSPSILNEISGVYYEQYPHVTCSDTHIIDMVYKDFILDFKTMPMNTKYFFHLDTKMCQQSL